MNNQTIDFRQYLVNKHLSANTIKSYMTAVTQYESMFDQYDAESLDSYKHYMTKNHKPQTINLRILAINKYLAFIGKGHLALPLIKIQHASFSDNVVSPKDYSRMKQGLLKDEDLRWYYMIWTMGATGARVSELVRIRIEDIIQGYVDILSKGDKTRRLYFPIQLRKSVYQWGESQGQLSGYLFTNNRGEPISTRGFAIHLKKIAKKYGINTNCIHPHSFRHMYAKSFLDKRSDVTILSDILGHESIKTTQIYLRRSYIEQKRIIDKTVTW